MEYGIRYVRSDGVQLRGYTDSNWVGSEWTGKAPQGAASAWDQVISWFSRK
jgi:hypothetical protein